MTYSLAQTGDGLNKMDYQHRDRILRTHGITPAEWSILCHIKYSPLTPRQLLSCTFQESLVNNIPEEIYSQDELADALRMCLDRKLAKVFGPADVEEIQRLLKDRPGIGPIHEMPSIGEVDFTTEGASLFSLLIGEIFPNDPWRGGWAGVRDEDDDALSYLYAENQLAAGKALFHEVFTRQDTTIVRVEGVGRWYANWWKCFEGGWKITIRHKSDPE